MGIFYGALLVERRDFPISFGEHDKVPTISLAEQQLRVIKEQSTVPQLVRSWWVLTHFFMGQFFAMN